MKRFIRWFKPVATPTLILCAMLSFQFSLLTGCASRLQTGGAYAPAITNNAGVVTATAAPDFAFFVADSAFDVAYSTVDGAFKFEKDNRAMLWKLSPQIKRTLDQIRPQAWEALKKWAVARKAYLANPVPANLTALQQVLAEMQRLTSAATAALPK